ncbi:MAG: lysophospholipid acyltransferase family protein [candidate division Zixibacteria bacterium]|nr:lysophospholipid acyltransferase family protein [candidate division Zixibacteria bacterium]
MKQHIKGIKNYIFYIMLRAVMLTINALPIKIAYLLTNLLAKLAYLIFTSDRKTAFNNLKMVFPVLSDEQIKKIYINSLKNIGYSGVDVLRFKKFGKQGILEMVTVEGIEHFDKAYARGKGIMAITGHISNFELIAAWFGQKGYKSSAIGRRLYDQRFNKLLIENRNAMNVRNLDSEASIRHPLKTLREGYAIGVLIDQDSRRYRGEFIDFFGKPAYTPVGPIFLSRKAQATVSPMIIIRMAPLKYKLTVFPEVKFDYKQQVDKDIKRVLSECTKILENTIRENPEHWVWMHKRWKTKPEDIE